MDMVNHTHTPVPRLQGESKFIIFLKKLNFNLGRPIIRTAQTVQIYYFQKKKLDLLM